MPTIDSIKKLLSSIFIFKWGKLTMLLATLGIIKTVQLKYDNV